MTAPRNEALMTRGEVAGLFRVNAAVVTRWEKAGKLTAVRTPGGHRRFLRVEIDALLRGQPLTRAQAEEVKRQLGSAS